MEYLTWKLQHLDKVDYMDALYIFSTILDVYIFLQLLTLRQMKHRKSKQQQQQQQDAVFAYSSMHNSLMILHSFFLFWQ